MLWALGGCGAAPLPSAHEAGGWAGAPGALLPGAQGTGGDLDRGEGGRKARGGSLPSAQVRVGNLDGERGACKQGVRSTADLSAAAESCEVLVSDATEQLDHIRRWRRGSLSSDEKTAVDELELKAVAARESG